MISVAPLRYREKCRSFYPESQGISFGMKDLPSTFERFGIEIAQGISNGTASHSLPLSLRLYWCSCVFFCSIRPTRGAVSPSSKTLHCSPFRLILPAKIFRRGYFPQSVEPWPSKL